MNFSRPRGPSRFLGTSSYSLFWLSLLGVGSAIATNSSYDSSKSTAVILRPSVGPLRCFERLLNHHSGLDATQASSVSFGHTYVTSASTATHFRVLLTIPSVFHIPLLWVQNKLSQCYRKQRPLQLRLASKNSNLSFTLKTKEFMSWLALQSLISWHEAVCPRDVSSRSPQLHS